MKMRSNSGFTLVELLVAIALGLVILAGLYNTFKSQHDSYIVQDQVAAMQQNLRAAMYMITRDLQMAGYYTNFDRDNTRSIDLGDDFPEQTGRPLFFPINNYDLGGETVREGTDVLVMIKAAEGTDAPVTTYIPEGTGSLSGKLSGFGDGENENQYGLLVKTDLRTADFFDVTDPNLNENYDTSDMVFRADIIIYKIEDEAGRPMLKRKNRGVVDQYHTVAENIENMQIMYHLENDAVPKHGDEIDNTNRPRIRAVEVILVGRTAHLQRGYVDTNAYDFADNPNQNPGGNYRRKVLSTIVKTRNVGLSS